VRKYTLLTCAVEAATAAFIAYQLWLNQGSALVPEQPRLSFDPTSELSPVDADQLGVVEELNQSARAIRTLSGKARFIIKRLRPLKIWADYHFENPSRSRVSLRSLIGREADMGSDDQHYWFWLKRKDPSRIYQGPYAQSFRAGFTDPVWLKEAIVLQSFDLRQAKLGKQGDLLVVSRSQAGLTRFTVIDASQRLVIGQYLYDADHQLTAFLDIQDHVRVGPHILPRVLNGGWPRDQVYVHLTLDDQQVNAPIAEDQWEKPAHLEIVDQ
jgi:hypothetical protein